MSGVKERKKRRGEKKGEISRRRAPAVSFLLLIPPERLREKRSREKKGEERSVLRRRRMLRRVLFHQSFRYTTKKEKKGEGSGVAEGESGAASLCSSLIGGRGREEKKEKKKEAAEPAENGGIRPGRHHFSGSPGQREKGKKRDWTRPGLICFGVYLLFPVLYVTAREREGKKKGGWYVGTAIGRIRFLSFSFCRCSARVEGGDKRGGGKGDRAKEKKPYQFRDRDGKTLSTSCYLAIGKGRRKGRENSARVKGETRSMVLFII